MEIVIFYNYIFWVIGFDVFIVGVRIRGRLEGVLCGDYFGWWVNFILEVRG